MNGENFVTLVGKMVNTNMRTFESGSRLFKAKMAIPIPNLDNMNQYIKIAAWGQLADDLNDVDKETFVKAHGHIEERSYDGKCRSCNNKEKKYWTEVVIDNFVIV
jgi:hypothetical protein